jgi:hypothetical protein
MTSRDTYMTLRGPHGFVKGVHKFRREDMNESIREVHGCMKDAYKIMKGTERSLRAHMDP